MKDDAVSALEYTICDLCGSSDFLAVMNDIADTNWCLGGRFTLVRCRECGLYYLNPRPSRSEIGRYYPETYLPYEISSRLVRYAKQIFWMREKRLIRRYVPRGSAVLEVGCASGEFLAYFRDRYKVYGLEMDERAAREGRRVYGLDIWTTTFEEFVPTEPREFDVVMLRYVLEHLASPKAALAKMRGLLKEGGYALVSVPNFESWDRKVFGTYWHCLDAPRHFYIFTRETMARYVREAGFRIVNISQSAVPNDWIGGVRRFLNSRGWTTTGKFFSIKNPFLFGLALPVSIAAAVAGKSSRCTFLLQKSENRLQ